MLITPRVYRLAQTPNNGSRSPSSYHPTFHALTGWDVEPADYKRAADMLLMHQVGSVRVGEVVRFTLTYTPSADRILPTPAELFVKVRNTSAIPLRAAYLHGPYTLYTSCYPSSFDPNRKYEDHETRGLPQFEPNLKAGGAFDAVIPVPESASPSPLAADGQSVTWIIEIASQVIFSTSAAVNFEVLVGRDLKSLELGMGSSASLPAPGHVRDLARRGSESKHQNPSGQMKGVYSTAVNLVVEDTASLWSTPRFPSWSEKEDLRKLEMEQTEIATEPQKDSEASSTADEGNRKKRRKVHFVVLTHGLHSNLGADMLYLKESIDAAARKAREDARKERNKHKNLQSPNLAVPGEGTSDMPPIDRTREASEDDDDDDEHVIVRGFPGNAVRTERGIQYLGKRLAKYVLLMTYPDQPYLPIKESRRKFRAFTGNKDVAGPLDHASHSGSTVYRPEPKKKDYAYQITSISFISHSLGGLVQTYAIAYIQKHSPEFFDRIKPVNFVALASPFLGLSNENPIYVRFALDFGLVGRTGQDLGLSWTAPSKMRSGWGAMIGGLGNDSPKSSHQPDPKSKPLLRILPSGPAHQVLKKFRNRTVYSNVVNDGIVPLRTSCLLFLDWRGLDRVEKARRENGLVGTMAEWGWAEITGANVNTNSIRATKRPTGSMPTNSINGDSEDDKVKNGKLVSSPKKGESEVPKSQGDSPRTLNGSLETTPELPKPSQFLTGASNTELSHGTNLVKPAPPSSPNPFSSFLSLFKAQGKSSHQSKGAKIYKRIQTVRNDETAETPWTDGPSDSPRTRLARGDSFYQDEGHHAPPKTTILEAAGDVLKPPLPSTEYILNPATRARTIFHDRVYHPSDIPPPPPIRSRSFFPTSSTSNLPSPTSPTKGVHDPPSSQPIHTSSDSVLGTTSGMKVEEKIARAYHRDLSWRKVLVRLEPDAHNNIIVRRMFANAYGWPVVKHLVDTHFANTITARTADELESGAERAVLTSRTPSESGKEVLGQVDPPGHPSTPTIEKAQHESQQLSESSEAKDELHPISSQINPPRIVPYTNTNDATTNNTSDAHRPVSSVSRISSSQSKTSHPDSSRWTDRYFDDEDGEGYDSQDEAHFTGSGIRVVANEQVAADNDDVIAGNGLTGSPTTTTVTTKDDAEAKGTSKAEITAFLATGSSGGVGN
ncbi:hypothetical protein RJZ56_001792 [Blastomyces dermatitidis]|uniref:Lipase/serine esterase n=1 Tax=Ajellomyces dermatitidis (strain ER-3 / ATCC MYA-2586) TaxID=559297 RepID=A0ABP2ER20_AJEDR|nr:lipase/serine esterase [Blastomyces dermatitidis ER-3]EEQ86099.1 lipase/serine esterase [Blastomyces dermatitidis ER-3]